MGFTMTEKVISKHLVAGSMRRGSRIGVKIDQTLTHDVNGVMAYLEFEAMGVERVKTEISVSYIDHNLIQADYKNPDDHRYLLDIAEKHGIIVSRPGNGICHQVHLERFSCPAKTLLGTDSHTPMAGGIGMLGLGAGGLDVAMAMAGEAFFLTMPKIIKVNLTGKLQPYVSAKNVILELLRRLTVKGAVNKVLEYTGAGVKTLSVPERAIITNMGTETGATSSLFPSDDITKQWFAAQERQEQWIPLEADADATYDEVIDIDLSTVQPLIALPHQPDRILPIEEVAGTPVDQIVIGSCANSSLLDMTTVAALIKGHKIHKHVDAGVYIGSKQVYLECAARGILGTLAEAGIRILESGCGACNGSGFAPPTEGVSLRTTTRNFIGRSGTASAGVYLVAPETAVAAAVTGVITDPRTLANPVPDFTLPAKLQIEDSMLVYPPDVPPNNLVVRRGPNIRPLPEFDVLPEVLTGEVLIKVGEDITTDHIVPAGANFLPIRNNTPEISKYVFHVLDASFAERAKASQGGFVVAGENYGQGSSREQAALAPRFLGVQAIVAKGFARIHLANLVNFGIMPLVFSDPADYDKISQGDTLTIELTLVKEKAVSLLTNSTTGQSYPVTTPLFQEEIDIINQGGRLNWIKVKQKAAIHH